jgi:thiamine biosynthesis lipoprotein
MSTQQSRATREIEVWGTIIWVECRGRSEDQLNIGIDKVAEYFEFVDQVFSTYKPESEVSRIRYGNLKIEQACEDLKEVWSLCIVAKQITEGSFDPWAVTGGFDPSGYVKGWAADRAIEILKDHGASSIQINAAGDLSLAGGTIEEGQQTTWKIGIRHPEEAHTIVKVFELNDGAVATSGTYERGAHIRDPHTGLIAIGARSASVIGPDGGLADALATALVVSGRDGAVWFSKPELAEYSAWVIDRNEDTSWEIVRDK